MQELSLAVNVINVTQPEHLFYARTVWVMACVYAYTVRV
jgi:hypothetical protein